MTDVVTFGMRLGFLVDPSVGLYLRRLLRIRNAAIRTKAEEAGRDPEGPPRRYLSS